MERSVSIVAQQDACVPTTAAVRLGLLSVSAFSRLGSTAGRAAKISSLAASEWFTIAPSTPAAGVMSLATLLARHLAVTCSSDGGYTGKQGCKLEAEG